MKQNYAAYTPEDHAVWQILFERQIKNLEDKACALYLEKLNEMKAVLFAEQIPDFVALNEYLFRQTGWQIEVVKGLIPVGEFFELLAQKKFPSSTWLRTRAQLDYLEEPDMFHDIFGHIPLLVDKDYADNMHQMGLFSQSKSHAPAVLNMLERFYWFTIEFGLVSEAEQRKIYGAGILSSYGESKVIYQPETRVRPFDLAAIVHHEFTKSELQQEYFQLDSMEQVKEGLDGLASSALQA